MGWKIPLRQWGWHHSCAEHWLCDSVHFRTYKYLYLEQVSLRRKIRNATWLVMTWSPRPHVTLFSLDGMLHYTTTWGYFLQLFQLSTLLLYKPNLIALCYLILMTKESGERDIALCSDGICRSSDVLFWLKTLALGEFHTMCLDHIHHLDPNFS